MKSSLIDIILNSEKRKNVLLLLMEGEKSREEIKTSLNVTSTALIPQIKKLKEHGLVIQNGDHYILTNMGKVLVANMLPLLNAVDVFEENSNYWLNRDLSGIPESILKRFGELGNCVIIEPDLNYLFEFPKEFTENIVKSSYVMAFNAYFHPEYPALYSSLAEKGIDVSLVVTAPVHERMEKDYSDDIQKFMTFENTEMFVSNEMTSLATLVTTDRFLFLCFFNKHGQYDHTILMSFDNNALQWSKELFLHFKEKAEIIA
ncbi:Predicted transcriptional regulator, contains HTH domain [Methanolobus vulcani]|jgi:predicted transcriptional regulator|uniref:Predicted transcriptional regulator, contains HTH domain n=1 Tax=Methanolobus vulcani TaxID=38026 RepID=A0A7Z7FD55_9EURY|nr:winged helix-turn-helix domain-containing protein [Methanolobus vulcani]SDG08738.1 Predicted transcriptional regulator, contains HTH domain [Methanolobus vulcani]